jgi:DNA-binding MarR family transcriptional regulator
VAGPDDAQSLVDLSGLVQAVFGCVAAQYELPPTQARLLCVLAQSPRGMADLARQFGVEKAALTGLVDRAERRGLVHRAAVPGDRRAVRVTLTADGLRSATEFHAAVTAQLNQLLAPLGPTQLKNFRAALNAINQAAGTLGCSYP